MGTVQKRMGQSSDDSPRLKPRVSMELHRSYIAPQIFSGKQSLDGMQELIKFKRLVHADNIAFFNVFPG